MRRAILIITLVGCGTVEPQTDADTLETSSTLSTTEGPTTSIPDVIDEDGDGFSVDEDCDDQRASVYPGAEEICDELDNDCDDEVDEGVLIEIWPDSDEDGFGDLEALPYLGCEPGSMETDQGGDCDDTSMAVYPDAPERCNSGVDEDCNPLTSCDGSCLPEVEFALCGNAAMMNPKLHWTYDNISNSQVVDDGWAGLDGHFVGSPTFGPGQVGDAAFFDGQSWIEALSELGLPGDTWTYVTWVRASGLDNAGPFHFLMSNGNGTPAYSGANFYLQDGLLLSAYTESGGNPADERLFVGEHICDDDWTQVALTFEQGDARLWVNGVSTLTQVGYTHIGWGAHPFAVGNDPNITSRHFVGELDETRVFDSKLGATGLAALRAEPFCP